MRRGMSSGRSRSGGMAIGMTLSLKKMSSRNRPFDDEVLETPAGGGDDAGVEGDRFARAARLVFLFDHRLDELGLGLEAHVADLVEEERPAVGQEELALLVLEGVGGVVLEIAEQLAFDELVGDGRAIDLDEALVRPPALLMEEAGDQLLARPALAGDEDPAVGRRGFLDLAPQLLDRGAFADQVEAGLDPLAELDVLLLELLLAERVLDGQDDLLQRERLFEEIERAELGGRDGRLDGPVAGDDHDLRALVRGPDPLQDVEAVHLGEPDVEQHEAEVLGLEQGQPGLARLGRPDDEALVLEDALERGPDARFVVDDQDAFLSHGLTPAAGG